MRVGLFIPCYVDQFYPQVGIATLQLLEKAGCEVVYPAAQTCCGQPMANSGFEHLTKGCNELFIKNFHEFDYIVSPSGSCVLHIKDHLHAGQPQGYSSGLSHGSSSSVQPLDSFSISGQSQGSSSRQSHSSASGQPHEPSSGDGPSASGDPEEQAQGIRGKIYELVEFLTDILKIEKLDAKFQHRVGVHQSCHGQRGLKLAQMTELMAPPFSKPEQLLHMVEGIQLIELDRKDECCGFGGTFCVAEEAVSVKMGKDRVADHIHHGAEYITAADMSCLMHMEGILRRQKSPVKVIHIAEILNGR